MKKFTFSLDRLKQYRSQVEEMEKNDLATLRAALSALKEQERAIVDAVDKKTDELRQMLQNGAFPNEINMANRFINTKKQELVLKRMEIASKQKEIDDKLEQVLEASKEVKKLEKLEEHQLEEYRKLETKENENFIEEFFGGKSENRSA